MERSRPLYNLNSVQLGPRVLSCNRILVLDLGYKVDRLSKSESMYTCAEFRHLAQPQAEWIQVGYQLVEKKFLLPGAHVLACTYSLLFVTDTFIPVPFLPIGPSISYGPDSTEDHHGRLGEKTSSWQLATTVVTWVIGNCLMATFSTSLLLGCQNIPEGNDPASSCLYFYEENSGDKPLQTVLVRPAFTFKNKRWPVSSVKSKRWPLNCN